MKKKYLLVNMRAIVVVLVILFIAMAIIGKSLESYGVELGTLVEKGFLLFLTISAFIIVIFVSTKLAKYTKDVVVNVGRYTLDVCTVLDVILCTIILIVGFFQCVGANGISSYIWWYVLGAIVIFLLTLLTNYTLYLLIDIRDSLRKLADYIDKKGE